MRHSAPQACADLNHSAKPKTTRNLSACVTTDISVENLGAVPVCSRSVLDYPQNAVRVAWVGECASSRMSLIQNAYFRMSLPKGTTSRHSSAVALLRGGFHMMLKKQADRPQIIVRSILVDGRGGVLGTVDVQMPTDLHGRIQRSS